MNAHARQGRILLQKRLVCRSYKLFLSGKEGSGHLCPKLTSMPRYVLVIVRCTRYNGTRGGVEIAIQYEAQPSTVWSIETRHECHYIAYSLSSVFIVLVGDSKAPGRSLSESTGLRPHAASVKIDRPIFALAASGLKQLAKASCGSPGCPTRC